jgi:hypothetical protein
MAEKKTFWMLWMNRTRYKDSKGKLIINSTPSVKSEEEAREAFASYTKTGYACQLRCADLQKLETINFENPKGIKYVNMKRNEQIIEENDRWKLRMKERDIQRLINRKAMLDSDLKAVTAKLKELQGE